MPNRQQAITWTNVNTLRPRQIDLYFPDDIFKYILLNENVWVLIKISLKLVPTGTINNIQALIQIMTLHRPGDMPLSEPMVGLMPYGNNWLTHWGRVTHICVGTPTIIGSDNGLPPEQCQAIIWTNAGILLIGPLGTNFSEILIEIHTFSLKKVRLKMSSVKCFSFRLSLNVLI